MRKQEEINNVILKIYEENARKGFELVAEGKYEAVIVNVEAGKTQAGKPKLSVDFEICCHVQQNL